MKTFRLIFLLTFFYISCKTPTSNQSVAEFPIVPPEDAGVNGDTLALIENKLQWLIDSSYIAGGVVIIAKDNKIIYQNALGYSNREKTEKLVIDNIFRMASMTKSITSAAVMQLIEKGKISLEDPVSNYIPEFKHPKIVIDFNPEDNSYALKEAKNTITIHHLLTHTSGLAYKAFHPIAGVAYSPFGLTEAWTKDSVRLSDVIPQMGQYPLMHEPGEKFTYGVSIDVLGRIVEIVSGLPLDQYFEKNIFTPLDMHDTYFYLPKEKYNRLVDVWIVPGKDIDPNNFMADYPISGSRTYFSGGGGLSSTAMDYLKFASALLNHGSGNGNRILKEETVELMMSNRIDSLTLGDGEKFGYGGSVYVTEGLCERKPGRYSWGGFWQTKYWVDPYRNIVAVILTNAYPGPKGGELFDSIETIVNKAVK